MPPDFLEGAGEDLSYASVIAVFLNSRNVSEKIVFEIRGDFPFQRRISLNLGTHFILQFLEKLFLKEQKAVEGGGEGWCKSWLLHKAGDQRGWQPGKANQISLKLRKDFSGIEKR